MDASQRSSGRGRERVVLAAGLASALALVWAAFASYGDADVAGEVALQRLAGEIADEVAAEWERMLRDPSGPAPPVSETFQWDAADSIAAPRAARDVRPLDQGELPVFATLLREAQKKELAGEDEDALELVLEALRGETDESWRAEGRLRAIQYAVRAEAPLVAREQWEVARTELSGRDARGATSYLLLCALAAAPALEPGERGRMAAFLAGLWERGDLALPDEPDRLVREIGAATVTIEPSASVAALRERLCAIDAAVPVAKTLARDTERRRLVALRSALGTLPEPNEGRAWHVSFHQLGAFAARRVGGGTRGHFVDARTIEETVVARTAAPEGFRVDFTGEDEEAGPVVKSRTPLSGTELGFTLRHANPARLMRAERNRLLFLRAALLVLAVFSGAASFFTFRALRRERRLAELKSSFIAGVSHDLRTPLASILLMAENLEEGRVAGDSAQRYYGSIRREADRLRRLVDDVLDFSRIDRGEAPRLHFEDVHLGRFFDELEGDLRERVATTEVAFTLVREDLPPSATLDAEAVRRAAWNLVDNALKHSGAKSIAVSARVEDGRFLCLSVSDDGKGIPDTRRGEIFRPFERLASNGNGAQATGTGLGLAIVGEIARAHGGTVSVRDGEDGKGAMFQMRLDLTSGTNPLQEPV